MFDGNATSIIIALVAVVSLMAGAIIWFGKWATNHYGDDIKEHTIAANKLADASDKLAKSNIKMAAAVDKNTESNDQVLTFMKNLNGKLAAATIQTIKEQHIEHQEVKVIKEK